MVCVCVCVCVCHASECVYCGSGRLQILCGIANCVASSLSYPIKVISTDWKWWPWPFPLLALAEERGPRTTAASNQGWRVTQLHASCTAKPGLCPWMVKTKKKRSLLRSLSLYTFGKFELFHYLCVENKILQYKNVNPTFNTSHS